jgi:hypothetical protein
MFFSASFLPHAAGTARPTACCNAVQLFSPVIVQRQQVAVAAASADKASAERYPINLEEGFILLPITDWGSLFSSI